MKPHVVEIQKGGKRRWRVNLGKRITGDSSYHRRFFKSKKTAEDFYRRVTKEIALYGAEFAKLSEPVRAGLAKFYGLLQSKNLSLEAVSDLIEKHQASSLTVTDAIAAFYNDCTDGRLQPGTMREYRSQLGRFELKFGNQSLIKITKKLIKDWLDKLKLEDRTQKNYITTLRTFFEFCMREETIEKNPAKLIRKPTEYAKEVVILTVDDVVTFTNYICVHEPKMIAALAIALFAGVRTCELVGLLWSDIDFAKRQIRIRLEISKKPNQKERWIPMSDNLFAWLSVCQNKQGKVCPYSLNNLWKRRRKAFRKATGKRWPKNGARKSFASYSWSVGRDVKHTSGELGNSPAVAEKYYIAQGEEEKGRQFLQVLPKPQDTKTPAGEDKADSSPVGTEKIKE